MKTEAKEVLKEIQKTSQSVRSEVETIKSVVDKTYNIVVDHHYKVRKEITKVHLWHMRLLNSTKYLKTLYVPETLGGVTNNLSR